MADTLDPLDPSPYKVLNVPKDANLATIRSAHRKLVLITHPDKVQDEAVKKVRAEQFHQVQQSYEILSDDNRRRRWDERAKLAELRAEIAEERGPLRRAQTFAAPRSTQSPMFEMRGGRVYEERVPKSARVFEEDVFGASFGAEAPRPSRKYEDRYDDTPPRKTSGRGPEDRRRYMDTEEDFYDRRAREKKQREEVRSAQNEKQKQRDKLKRKDTEAKFSTMKSYAEDGASDSDDYDDRHYSSKSDSKSKRKDDERIRHRDEPPRRGSKKDAKGGHDPELDRKIYDAHDYISKSRENTESDRKRPGRSRTDSYQTRAQLPSPPLTPVDRDFGRRSSGDDGRRSSARARVSRPPSPARKPSKNKGKLEIVDPPSTRKTSLPMGGLERSGLKDKVSSLKREPQRAATFAQESKPSRKPGLQRAETMPIDQMRQERDPRKSKLKNMAKPPKIFDDVSSNSSDSDSGSDSEPDIVIPPKKSATQPLPQSRRYKVSEDSPRSPFIVTAEEEYPHHRSRDVSPKSARRSGDRYGGSTRTPPARASTFQERPVPRHGDSSRAERHMPPLKTSYSSREPKDRLFGELEDDYSPKSQHGSPKIYPDDRFKNYPRRSSEDVDRDAYAYNLHKSHRRPHHRSGEVYAS